MKLLAKLALIAKTLARGSRKQKPHPILPLETREDEPSAEHQDDDDGAVLTDQPELEHAKVADLLQRKLGTDSPLREKGDDAWVD